MKTTPHTFQGKWITDEEFYLLPPRTVFHRQLEKLELDCSVRRNRHILFRKAFEVGAAPNAARIFISADDCYKLYVNGVFVAQGPTPAYHSRYNYNEIDLTPYLKAGKNILAVHTLYQGLINRVWQSGDDRHGLILDLEIDGKLAVSSDESFRMARHTGYRETGTVGYDTGFLEEYDCRAIEVGFEREDFDDSLWAFARISQTDDRILLPQTTEMLTYERIFPCEVTQKEGRVFVDFGGNFVGYLEARAKGKEGEKILVRMGQELNEDGTVRYRLRARCNYEEGWILSKSESRLEQYDYKAFRYAELLLPAGCKLLEVTLLARHYPFSLAVELRPEFKDNPFLRRIWDLCVRTQKYGVQEAVLDCMEREKGFYIGDGCYTALTNMALTGKDGLVRKLIDDGFASAFITDGLVTCLNCSFMQEIAEYPLILIKLVLWHYRYTGDREYLRENYEKAVALLEVYRRDYEHDYLLSRLDKWCVVEWPKNFQDGYAVDIREWQVCDEAHVSINAYYLDAIAFVNKMAAELSLPSYRDEAPLRSAFYAAFYDGEKGLFKDGIFTEHISLIGNLFPYAFGLCPDERSRENILQMLMEREISSVSLFGAFLYLEGLIREGKEELIKEVMLCKGAWLRMLSEGATTTFEGWGKDTKWNTSLFHLTLSYGALFLADFPLERLFKL